MELIYFFEAYQQVVKTVEEHHTLPKGFKRSREVGERMKEPSTVESFIKILSEEDEGHNLSFTGEEERTAQEFFRYNNYYNFSIFPKLLPPKEEQYTFTDAFRLYQIDEFLRREIYYFTSQIEKWVKTSVAYHLSHMYESSEYAKAECYLDPILYNSHRTYLETLENFAETLHKSKEPFIEHHFKQRNGCMPIWVLVEELTFGQIDTFLSVLNTEYRNEWSDKVFGRENRKFILSWISVSRYLRNIAAHHGRFYGKKYIVLPKLKKEDMKCYGITNQEKNTLFVVLLILKSLLSFHTLQVKHEWNLFIDNLEEILNDNQSILDYPLNGLSENWKSGLIIETD
jgi:abortive infection bacteriophage resistance protein